MKILTYSESEGFKVVDYTSVKMLKDIEKMIKEGIFEYELLDMREVTPIEEIEGNFFNIGNVDFSFDRIYRYFEEGLVKVQVTVNGSSYIEEMCKDRVDYLLSLNSDKFKITVL